jgi:hypothetical protein
MMGFLEARVVEARTREESHGGFLACPVNLSARLGGRQGGPEVERTGDRRWRVALDASPVASGSTVASCRPPRSARSPPARPEESARTPSANPPACPFNKPPPSPKLNRASNDAKPHGDTSFYACRDLPPSSPKSPSTSRSSSISTTTTDPTEPLPGATRANTLRPAGLTIPTDRHLISQDMAWTRPARRL